MAEIESETRSRWPVGEMAMVHRLGHVDVGDVSVAVAVSCPHRGRPSRLAASPLIDSRSWCRSGRKKIGQT